MGETVRPALRERMREWMSARNRPFYFCLLLDGLGIFGGPVRYYVFRVLQDFIDRGEVCVKVQISRSGPDHMKKIMSGEIGGDWYYYNHSWRRPSDAPLKKKILRAMRLISFHDPFSVADVQNLAGAAERSYVDLLIRNLAKENYVHRVGVRTCPHGVGKESLYRVSDLGRFRVDLL